MKKAFYSFLIAACMLLMLSMTALADWSGNGMSGGQSSAGGYGSTGASYTKTGYLVYVADNTGHKVTGTKIVFWPWNGSIDSSVLLTGVKTKVGEFFNYIESEVVPWGTPLFNYDSSDVMVSNEPIIKQFVVSPYGDCESGGEYLLRKYLGASDAMWDTFTSGDYYLCIEGVMWCGVYDVGREDHEQDEHGKVHPFLPCERPLYDAALDGLDRAQFLFKRQAVLHAGRFEVSQRQGYGGVQDRRLGGRQRPVGQGLPNK